MNDIHHMIQDIASCVVINEDQTTTAIRVKEVSSDDDHAFRIKEIMTDDDAPHINVIMTNRK